MTRCFIAIDLPGEVKNEIVKIQNQLPEFRGKLTEKNNLHLTLKFLGEIEEEMISKAEEKLKCIKFKKFKAKLGGIGIFSESFIRIVWIKLENCDKLQEEVDKSLNSLFKKEKRFMSHLTIARVKLVKDKRKFIDLLDKIKIAPVEFEASSFALKKSTLTKQGSVYEDLMRFELA